MVTGVAVTRRYPASASVLSRPAAGQTRVLGEPRATGQHRSTGFAESLPASGRPVPMWASRSHTRQKTIQNTYSWPYVSIHAHIYSSSLPFAACVPTAPLDSRRPSRPARPRGRKNVRPRWESNPRLWLTAPIIPHRYTNPAVLSAGFTSSDGRRWRRTGRR